MQKKGDIMNLRKNVKRNYLFVVLSRFDLTQGIWMLYLAYRGLSLFEIGIMETIYHISSFLMEIPTGMIADVYGRKTSRILGRMMSVVSILIMILGQNVVAFAISFFFSALSNNLESGAGDALIYDSLKEIKEEDDYLKISGRNELFYQVTSTVALLLGGYIATISYDGVYLVALVAIVISVVQAFSFEEPTIGKVEQLENPFKTFVNQLVESFKAMLNNKAIIKMIAVAELFATFFTTIFFYIQNYFKLNGKTEFEIGIILALGAVAAALMATQAHTLEKRFKLKNVLTGVAIIGMVGLWGITIKGLEPYAYILLSGAEGVLFVTVSDFVNKRIPSERRATILSVQSMVFSVYMIILFPIVGYIGDQFGLDRAFFIIAIISTLALAALIKMARKK